MYLVTRMRGVGFNVLSNFFDTLSGTVVTMVFSFTDILSE